MLEVLKLYQFSNFKYRYSKFTELESKLQNDIWLKISAENKRLVEILAYCLMPTHIHLILKQIIKNGITKYMARVLNSYSRYFNLIHKRIGPLWSGRFKSVLVDTDEQLLHLTRYIHLNPTSAGMSAKPEDWLFSSYREYINLLHKEDNLCRFGDRLDISPEKYQRFVDNQQDYQKKLSQIKKYLIDDYTG